MRSIAVAIGVSVEPTATIEFNAHLHLVVSLSEWENLVAQGAKDVASCRDLGDEPPPINRQHVNWRRF